VGKFDERKEKYGDKEVILLAPKGHLTKSNFPLDVAGRRAIFPLEREDFFYAQGDGMTEIPGRESARIQRRGNS
jgi:hypothetical protein